MSSDLEMPHIVILGLGKAFLWLLVISELCLFWCETLWVSLPFSLWKMQPSERPHTNKKQQSRTKWNKQKYIYRQNKIILPCPNNINIWSKWYDWSPLNYTFLYFSHLKLFALYHIQVLFKRLLNCRQFGILVPFWLLWL